MEWAVLSWAFVAGAFATVNPCGIAMLPAYISYYLGQDEGKPRPGRGIRAGLLLSVGTLAVFSVMGLLVAGLGAAIARFVPWVVLIVAVLLLIAGVATLLGRAPSLALSGAQQAPRDRSSRSFVIFGVGYGLASLGCTLPVFMIVVSSVLAAGFVNGFLAFVAYGLGMGLVLTGLSLAVALGKTAALRSMQAAGAFLKYVGGLGLLAAGSYLIYYNLRAFAFMYREQAASLPMYIGIASFLISLAIAMLLKMNTRRQGQLSA